MARSGKAWLGFVVTSFLVGCGGGAESPSQPSQPASTPSKPAASTSSAGTFIEASGSAAVEGRVVYQGEVPRQRPIKMDADPGCAKKHDGPVLPEALVLGDGNTMANVFVHVKSGLPEGRFRPPAEPAVLDQQGCRYVPHVLGIMIGQPLRILNSDGLLHNVHSLSEKNPAFNRAMPAAVTQADYSFDEEEVLFKVKCDVHPWMSSWIGVLRHPYFAVTGTDGRFRIEGLPAGTYEVEAWHERLGTRSATLTLAEAQTATEDYEFSR